jgi:hypothetical protein
MPRPLARPRAPEPTRHRIGLVSHVWFIVRWLHLLAMAFFVGGQMILAAVVVPVGRRSTDRESLSAIARRFGYGTLVALLVLIATGTAMASHLGLWGDDTFTSSSPSSSRSARCSPGTSAGPTGTFLRRSFSCSH